VLAWAASRAEIEADMDEEVVYYGASRIQDGGDREHFMVEAVVGDMQILMAVAEAEFKYILNVCDEHHSEGVSHRATARAAGETREVLERCDELEKATGIERSGYYDEAHGMTEYLLEENWEAVEALRNAGFVVSAAPNHHLALQILEGPEPPDLLITDVVMPGGVNGFALARMARMRRLELRVLYVTGYDLPTEEGIGKILRKPIDLDVLVTEARNALAGPPDPQT
jgi:CheY-like chemotaxis protein